MGLLRLQICYKYYRNFSEMCDVGDLQHTRLFCNTDDYSAETVDYTKLELRALNLKRQKGIRKYTLVKAFISFLLQLLHPEVSELSWSVYSKFKVQILNLEKELRILLTILGDSSLIPCNDEHKEFQKLLAKFEAVANEAASLVHFLVFPSDPVSLIYLPDHLEDLDVVLNHIDLLKTNIMKFLYLLPPISPSAYADPKTTSVMDALLILDCLINDLEDLMNREDNRIAEVKDQIITLYQALASLQFSIKDIGSPHVSDIGELKEPFIQIGDVAHKAEYVIISFLVGDAPLWYLINRLTDFNAKIELIATELVEITNKYKSHGLKVTENFNSHLSLQATENTEVDDITVGFENNTTDILDQLVGGGTERLQVLSIFGMPGIGKTTLAKKLYNHPSVTYRFDRLSWCVVSQTYLRQGILANILIQIASELEKNKILEMDEECLIDHIHKTLKKRRYLIVIDDIWTSDVWDDLRRCFPDDGNGSRVLFTTRNKDVAPQNSIIYPLHSWSNDQCWELLKKKVFNNERPCPPELHGIGKKIAANCSGLPLAVVVIAGILSTMNKERSTWEKVQENLASYIFDGGDNSSMMQILELSYKHLPDYLKPCFLYFGAYGEDEEIPARQLMRLWIAEGFVHKEDGKSREDVAEEYLNQLIDRSLVIVATLRSDGGVKACVIHDLLHDLCLRICEEKKFLKFEKSNINLMLGKHVNSREEFTYSASWSNCPHIRSFHGSRGTQILYVGDTKLLRILDIDPRIEHLIGIRHLVNLRYLVITEDLVATIGSLVNLEYLRVEAKHEYKKVAYLHATIMEMRKLRYIRAPIGIKYDEDCDSSQSNNLEYLSGIIISNLKDEEMLKCSPHLRNLKLSTQRSIDLCFLTELESLRIAAEGNKLEKFRFPSNIRKLTLKDLNVSWDKMSIIGRLENLEVLKLEGIGHLRESIWCTSDGEFQKLRILKLDEVRTLTQWNVESSQHFPRLERLILINCYLLEEIPSEIGEIATLQLIEVQGWRCRVSLKESAKRIQQEQQDMGNEGLRVIITYSLHTRMPKIRRTSRTPKVMPKIRLIPRTPKVRAPNKAKGVLQKLFTGCF